MHIASDFEIEEWGGFEYLDVADRLQPCIDVRIRSLGHDSSLSAGCNEAEYQHEIPGIANFLIRCGREIDVVPHPDADPRAVRAFLTASAWGILCYQRGLHLLHASAVRVGNHTFAFAGHSGAGKSSTAAWLERRGFSPVVDDIARIDIHTDSIGLHPSSGRLKLWAATLPAVGRSTEGLAPLLTKYEKYFVPLAIPTNPAPVRLDAIYLLEWGGLAIRRLVGARALERFLSAATYRSEFLTSAEDTRRFIGEAIAIVNRVPIFEYARPRDFAEMDRSVEALVDHWNAEFPQTPAP